MKRIVLALLAVFAAVGIAADALALDWEPAAFASEDVLEFSSVSAEGEAHWSKVWLVVLEGDVYIRLGNRAVSWVDENTEAPYMGIRIAGEEFPRVLTEPAPDMAERVAEAMADKYWSDVFASMMAHPLTLKLSVDAESAE
jgi:hypothetical protein